MVKFRKLKNKDIVNNPLERWLTFFDVTTPEKIIQEIIQMDSGIKKAYDKMQALAQDKEFLRQYHMREMAMSDWTTGVNTGIEKRLIEVAKNSLREGLPVEIIQKTTGLDM